MSKKWCCRICGHDEYAETFDKNYLCMGCTMVFASPSKFNLSKIKFKKIHPDAVIPTKGTDGSVGYDLYAVEDYTLEVNKTVLVKTGLQVELPPHVEMQVRPRSGLAKNGVRVGNAPGTIDPDYRGEIMVMMSYAFNIKTDNIVDGVYKGMTKTITLKINKGDRVAQALFTTKLPYELEEVFEISDTDRGANGFGSTGIK